MGDATEAVSEADRTIADEGSYHNDNFEVVEALENENRAICNGNVEILFAYIRKRRKRFRQVFAVPHHTVQLNANGSFRRCEDAVCLQSEMIMIKSPVFRFIMPGTWAFIVFCLSV